MYKKIIDNDTLNLLNIFSLLKKIGEKYYKIILLFIIVNSVLGLFGTPKYSASVSFYTDYNDLSKTGGSLNFFTSFTLNNYDHLNFSISNYLLSDNFYKKIIYDKYNINNSEMNLVDVWELEGNPSFLSDLNLIPNVTAEERKYLEAKELLDKAIKFSEDDDSGLNTIQVVVKKYPNLALELTDRIYTAIIEYFTDITQLKATEKISFIEGRLVEISSKLVEAESEMISFLEQNKKLTSPNLSIQRTRIQRDITVYSQLFVSLSDQLELAKIDAKNSVNPIFTLDDPVLSIEKFGSSIFVRIIQNFITIFILCFIIEVVRFRKQLFSF